MTKGEEDQVGWGGVLEEAVAVCLQSVFAQIIHVLIILCKLHLCKLHLCKGHMCKVYLCRCMCADCLGEGHTAVAFSQQVYFSFPPHPQQSTCSWLKVKVKVWVIEISTIATNIQCLWSSWWLMFSILQWLPGLRVKKISVCWSEWVLCTEEPGPQSDKSTLPEMSIVQVLIRST